MSERDVSEEELDEVNQAERDRTHQRDPYARAWLTGSLGESWFLIEHLADPDDTAHDRYPAQRIGQDWARTVPKGRPYIPPRF